MNELKELEKWLVTAIEDNDALYENAVNENYYATAYSWVCRGLAYESVLLKIHAIQRAQKRGE